MKPLTMIETIDNAYTKGIYSRNEYVDLCTAYILGDSAVLGFVESAINANDVMAGIAVRKCRDAEGNPVVRLEGVFLGKRMTEDYTFSFNRNLFARMVAERVDDKAMEYLQRLRGAMYSRLDGSEELIFEDGYTGEEYDNLLTHLIAGEMTAEKLYGAATDIVKHSDYDPNGFDTEADVIDKVVSDLMCRMQILEVSDELLEKLEKRIRNSK